MKLTCGTRIAGTSHKTRKDDKVLMMMNKQQHMLMTWLLSSIGVLKPSSTFRWLHMRRSLQIWRDSPEKSILDRSGGKVVGSLVEFPSIEELPGIIIMEGGKPGSAEYLGTSTSTLEHTLPKKKLPRHTIWQQSSTEALMPSLTLTLAVTSNG
ncbi:hypothetical protein LINPERHAP1_LOCUS26359 [Linum perenne]